MSAFVSGLRRCGVVLWADGGSLVYDAPAGVMMPARRAALAGRKAEVLAWLRAPAAGPAPQPPRWAAWAGAVARLATADVALRADVLFVFDERAGVLEYAGGLGRDEAERRALASALAELARHPRHRPSAVSGMLDFD